MIIVCKQCNRRYLIEDNILTQRGCEVKCIGCKYQWYYIEPALEKRLYEKKWQNLTKLNLYLMGFFNSFFILFIIFAKNFLLNYLPALVLLYGFFNERVNLNLKDASALIDNNRLVVSFNLSNSLDYLVRMPKILLKNPEGAMFYCPKQDSLLPREKVNIVIEIDDKNKKFAQLIKRKHLTRLDFFDIYLI